MKVFVQLTGGLGNQLFQVSFGDFLEKSEGCEVLYFMLCKSGAFEINELLQLRPDLKIINKWYLRIFGFFLNRPTLINYIPICSYEKYTKKNLKKIYFGFWQFGEFYNYLKQENIKIKIKEVFETLISKNFIYNKEVATMHIRGGDYLLLKHSLFHGNLGKYYYSEGLKLIKQSNIYCITDDAEYADLIIRSLNVDNKNIIILSKIYNTSTIEDFSIIASIGNGVIANSTFSWWAKFFADPNSIIVAPKKWTKSSSFNIVKDRWFYI